MAARGSHEELCITAIGAMPPSDVVAAVKAHGGEMRFQSSFPTDRFWPKADIRPNDLVALRHKSVSRC